ncbi:hypothetical protein HDU67_008140 [Dinochytrium kinnereticum]|nr:hypothetical protein HDU67_008140 [Dinochytrium kinnereticum]
MLWFAGSVDFLENLRNIPGLVIVGDKDNHIDLRNLKSNNALFEAVIGPRSSFISKSIRESNFRTNHNAAVIAVHRDGERVPFSDHSDVILRAGDVLLPVGSPAFQKDVEKACFERIQPPRQLYRAILAAALALSGILLATFEVINLLTAMIFAVTIMIIAGCMTADEARDSLSWEVLIAIAVSFGLGQAIQNSGAAIANGLAKASESKLGSS